MNDFLAAHGGPSKANAKTCRMFRLSEHPINPFLIPVPNHSGGVVPARCTPASGSGKIRYVDSGTARDPARLRVDADQPQSPGNASYSLNGGLRRSIRSTRPSLSVAIQSTVSIGVLGAGISLTPALAARLQRADDPINSPSAYADHLLYSIEALRGKSIPLERKDNHQRELRL